MDIDDPSFPAVYGRIYDPILDWTIDAVTAHSSDEACFPDAICGLKSSPLRTVAIVVYFNNVLERDNLDGWILEGHERLGTFVTTAFREVGADRHVVLIEGLYRKYPFLAPAAAPQLGKWDAFIDRVVYPGVAGTQEAADVAEFIDSYFGLFEELAKCLVRYIHEHLDETL